MTWVAFRQQRLQLLVTALLVTAVGAVMVYFRFSALSYIEESGIAGCQALGGQGGCSQAGLDGFGDRYHGYTSNLPFVLLVLPILVGMFAGAPLFAGELERKTHVFGLTQAVGRFRWWATKVLVAGLPVTVGMLALGLVATWALKPLELLVVPRMQAPGFETQGLVLGAYTMLASALGATANLLVRSTVAAMGITLFAYVVILMAVANGARPDYLEPQQMTMTVGDHTAASAQSPRDAMRVGSVRYLDSNGNEAAFRPDSCPRVGGTREIHQCLRENGVTAQAASFQPADRFWTFQWIESGIFFALGAALLGLGTWWLRRRVL